MLSDHATTYKALVSTMSSEASVCRDMTRVTPGRSDEEPVVPEAVGEAAVRADAARDAGLSR
jgi:hypothetical protein